MIKIALRALIATVLLAVLCGLVYPLVITGVAQLGFGSKADGSLVTVAGKVVGSSMIGQEWKGDQWFYGRPSAIDYDASTSSGTNLGPNSSVLEKDIADASKAILKEEGPYTPGLTVSQIPSDLLTSSGSGLDPDISEPAAMFQAPRIAAVRHLSLSQVQDLIKSKVMGPDLGFLGQQRINVLALNLALSQLSNQ